MNRWRRDPVWFVKTEFDVVPDKWQAKALRALVKGDTRAIRLAMRACAGPGKTCVLAWIGWWFLSCWGTADVHPIGAAVAITADNLADNLWTELARWQNKSPFLSEAFVWTKTRIFAKDHPKDWWLSARAIPRTANAEEQGRVLSGLHSPYIFYLMDETGDMPTPVLRTAEQGLTTCVRGLIAQAGNPTSTEGILHLSTVSQADMWTIISITGDPDDPLRSSRVDIEWARQQIELYGREDPWVMAYILGQFPLTAINSLLSADEVRQAMRRNPFSNEMNYAQKRIGVDVAREGLDKTVLFPRQGLVASMPIVMRGANGPQVAARLMTLKNDFGSEVEIVDDTGGYGSSVVDSCLQAGNSIIPINFSARANDPHYFNIRSQMAFEVQKWVRRGGCLPNVPELVAELSQGTYTFQKGKFRFEPKDSIKKKIGRSPDHMDSLGLTFAIPEAEGIHTPFGRLNARDKEKTLSDYDPYSDERMND